MTQMQETVLTFKLDGASGAGEDYIDIAKCMSMVNRKLHRQQGLWEVLGVQLFADANDINVAPPRRVGIPYTVSMSGAPRTWVTRNSLVKAFHAWKDQQQLALDSAGSESLKPRWEDFKVWLNDNHRTHGDITPVSGHMFGGDDPYMPGEWVQSKLVVDEVDGAGLVVQSEPTLHILGPNNLPDSAGLIYNYAISRALPFSPDPELPSSVALNIYTQSATALSEQVEEITSNMKTDNNDAPYDPDEYPGGSTNGFEPLLFGFVASTTGATKGRKTVMNGFAAPNGLIEVQRHLDLSYTGSVPDGVDYTDPELWIQLVVGRRSDY